MKNLSAEKLRTIGSLCAGAALLLFVGLLLSGGISKGPSASQEDNKPWALELP